MAELSGSASTRAPTKTWHFDDESAYTYASEVITVDGAADSLAELKKLPRDVYWTTSYKDPRPRHGPEYHTCAVGSDGCVVAVGETWDYSGRANTSELLLSKYDPDGALLPGWPRRYAGKGYRWQESQDVVVDASGKITIAGYAITFSNEWYYAVWRFDSDGNLLPGWPRYPVGDHAYGMGVAIDSSGDIVTCGGSGPHAVERLVLMKHKPNGTPVAGWPKTYQVAKGQSTFAFDLIQDSDGNLVVAGHTQAPSTQRDSLLYKFDTNGNVMAGWPRLWDSGFGRDDQYFSVSQDADGSYCLVGTSQDASSVYHLLVNRLSREGGSVTGWPVVYPLNGGFDCCHPPDSWHGSVDSSGNIAASYSSLSLTQIRTLKYAPDGAVCAGFPKLLSRPGYRSVTRYTAVDDLDNIYTVGYSELGSEYTTFVAKYPPASYSTGRPAVTTRFGVRYSKLTGFTEKLGGGNRGTVTYQLTTGGAKWYYHDGSKWAGATTKYQANTAAEINSRVGTFAQEAGIGTLNVRAFLVSNGSQKVQLHAVTVMYEGQR